MAATDVQEARALADGVAAFVRQEVLPRAHTIEDRLGDPRRMFTDDGRYVSAIIEARNEIRQRSAEAGFYTMFGAAELGGGDLGSLPLVAVFQSLYREFGPDHVLIKNTVIPSPFTNGLTPLLNYVSDSVKERHLEDIATGVKTLCFALSEPGAGSDPQSIQTRARREGRSWVISGAKQWITNAAYADFAIVFAVTDSQKASNRKGGITAFLVETTAPGFTVDRIIPVMGSVGGDPGAVSLDDVRVDDSAIIGNVDEGLKLALMGITKGRLAVGAICIGLAEWAQEKSIRYATERETFGKPIAEHQIVQFMLADSATDIYAGTSMTYDAAARVDRGSASAATEISMVKVFATEMAQRVVDRSIQIHGAMGLANEVGLERAFRQARLLRIPDGTSEIQRRYIAKRILRDAG